MLIFDSNPADVNLDPSADLPDDSPLWDEMAANALALDVVSSGTPWL